ncbi:MAG TPA: RNA 2',3'-cyclic phosphodiesterase [Planctomycetota bacterium]|nr:RNA 2',3'-cyclic phosphodiesterase [Planctomycetota bacterium]
MPKPPQKLFVAIDFPIRATEALTQLQPSTRPGIRVTKADQVHLTLHFIGEAEPNLVDKALQNVTFAPFELTLGGVGQFPSAGGTVTIWAGVRNVGKLLELHQEIGTALKSAGFLVEGRPYNPHVTLARCEPSVTAETIQEFLSRNSKFQSSPISIPGFWLYSSTSTTDGPVYQRESSYSFDISKD